MNVSSGIVLSDGLEERIGKVLFAVILTIVNKAGHNSRSYLPLHTGDKF